MSNFSRFMKQNKLQKENTTYQATKSLTDENGVALEWVIKPLTTKENDNIRDSCTTEIPVTGKPNMYRQKMNVSKYTAKMICASVVEPNLNNAELQDSYGVKTPEDLIVEMVSDPGEYSNFTIFIQKFNGFNETIEEKVEQAKN